MRIVAGESSWRDAFRFGTLLFDLKADPRQEHPLSDSEHEQRMTKLLRESLRANDAPVEQFERLGLTLPK